MPEPGQNPAQCRVAVPPRPPAQELLDEIGLKVLPSTRLVDLFLQRIAWRVCSLRSLQEHAEETRSREP